MGKKKAVKAKKTAPKGRGGGMAAFIRTFSKAIPAKRVVEIGAKKGFKIPLQYVYAVRSYKPAGKLKRQGMPFKNPPYLGEYSELEHLLRRHAEELKQFILSRL